MILGTQERNQGSNEAHYDKKSGKKQEMFRVKKSPHEVLHVRGRGGVFEERVLPSALFGDGDLYHYISMSEDDGVSTVIFRYFAGIIDRYQPG